jgi:hypothetical protein
MGLLSTIFLQLDTCFKIRGDLPDNKGLQRILLLSLNDWAKFRTCRGAVKLHLQPDKDGCLPAFTDLIHGQVYEIQDLKIRIDAY